MPLPSAIRLDRIALPKLISGDPLFKVVAKFTGRAA